jgi:hypothetical protein
VSEESIVNNVEVGLPNFGFSMEQHIGVKEEEDPAEIARWEVTPEERNIYD